MRPLLFFLLLVSAGLCAQAEKKPSRLSATRANFVRIMAEDDPTELELDTLYRHAIQYLFRNQDSCLFIAERGVALSKKRYPGRETVGDALMTLGDAHRVRSEWAAAERALLEGKEIYERLGVRGRVAAANMKLGATKIRVDEYEAALDYSFAALGIWQELKDTNNIFKPYFEIMEVFALLGEHQKALEYNGKALEWGETLEAPGIIRVALGNQSELQSVLADKYREMADTASLNKSVYQDSVAYFQEQALASINRTVALLVGSENKYRVTIALTQLADLQSDMGDITEARETIDRSLQLAEELGSGRLLLNARSVYGKVLRLSGNNRAAVDALEAALLMEEAESNSAIRNTIREQLYLAQKEAGRYAEALRHFEAITAFERENARTERIEAVATIEGRFQAAKKEKRILELSIANAEIRRQRKYFIGGAALLMLLGYLGFQFTRLRAERNRKRAFASQLIDAQEEERKRIARDLHDGIGQSLLVIKRQLDANQQSTRENRQLVAATLEEVRSISRDLHPVLLEKFGITATISDIVDRMAHGQPELFVSKDIVDVDGLSTPKAEVQIFRAVQEALSNVVKHAGATAAKVSVRPANGGVEVVVRDNGIGFNEAKVAATSKSLGLRTMQERMAAVNGRFSVGPGEPKGTVIRMWVPGREG